MVNLSAGIRGFALALAALVAFCAGAAAQQPAPGFYIDGEGGPLFTPRPTLSGSGIKSKIGADTGMALIGALGYRFENGARLEGEVDYRRATVSTVGGVPASGRQTALGWLANGLYDLPLGGAVTPFLGVGAGGARVSYDGLSPIGGSTINDADVAFAYQGIVGAAYNLSDRFQLVADYRYFRTLPATYATTSGSRVTSGYQAHAITLGFRWTFDVASAAPPAAAAEAAPAAAAPAAAPAAPIPQARSFVVFFDFDSAALTESAKRVIEEAAVAIRQAQATRIQVTGHADRAGPETYNFRLSLRRANIVKAELIRLGVSADQVEVAGKGMSEPAVPTPLGVREPRNRRAEIVF